MSGGSSGAEGEFLRRLRQAVERRAADTGPWSLLFSGGVDSALLAALWPRGAELQLVTVGRPGAPDLAAAAAAAKGLDRPWSGVIVSDSELAKTWGSMDPSIWTLAEPARSVAFATAVALSAAPTPDVVWGQGADELFRGYAHFRGLGPTESDERAAADLARLQGADWPRARELATRAGRRLDAPYLDEEVLAAALRLAPSAADEPAKAALRRIASAAGLPAEVAQRPKKALQYGSRIAAWVERHAVRPVSAPR